MPATPEITSRGAPEIVLGFDFGRARIGVAVANAVLGHATALAAINAKPAPDWGAIDALLAEWRPHALVVGLPLRMDDSAHDMADAALAFSAALEARYGLPMHTADEHLSSREAEARLRDSRRLGHRKRRVRKGETDSVAAQIILQTWMAESAPR